LTEINHKVEQNSAHHLRRKPNILIRRYSVAAQPFGSWIENFLQILVRDQKRPHSTVRASPVAHSTLLCDWSTGSGVKTVGLVASGVRTRDGLPIIRSDLKICSGATVHALIFSF